MKAEIGYLLNGGLGGGSAAQRLLANNFDVRALRTNAVLGYDEWKAIDTAVLEVARKRLPAVTGVMSRGQVYTIPNGLGKTVLQYQDISDMTAAQMSMSGLTPGNQDRIQFETKYLPLPVIFKDFDIDLRQLMASRNGGMPLDTTQAALAGKLVAEKIEDMFFNGASSFTAGGGTIYGINDFPLATTISMGTAWSNSGVTGDTIVLKVLDMKQELVDQRMFGPYSLYIGGDLETAFDRDQKTYGQLTVRQRILQIAGINEVVVADQMPAATAALVQQDAGTCRIANGLEPTVVQWEEAGGMLVKFKVMAILIPQFRGDQEDHAGVCICT